jgi:peptidoglycan hydrolase-like protein with peptidoglycan-binding domain
VARTRTGTRGRFTFPLYFTATGPHRFRGVRPHDPSHLAGSSAVLRVKAVQRSLHSGLAGPDVRALQRRLAQLHYDVGAINGTFGYDTLHAVIAFEKVQGLTRDGVVGLSVFRRLDRPRIPTLRHPADAASAGVEVDLAHQVLYYAVHRRIVRILDASTGGGYTYYDQDGSVHQAITPTGHFSVVYKRDGWVHAPLGDLWRPAYFNNAGYAIHGETEVPSYPASHGCVRVTVPAMNRLVNLLPIGISVWIY